MIFCVFHIWESIRRSSTKREILTKMKHQPSSCCCDQHSKYNSGCTLGTQATSWSTVLWHPLDIFLAFSFGCPVATPWMMILTRWGSLIWKNIVYINMIQYQQRGSTSYWFLRHYTTQKLNSVFSYSYLHLMIYKTNM